MIKNNIGKQFYLQGLIPTTGSEPVVKNLNILASGNTDIYTCPAGKKALITYYTILNNGSPSIFIGSFYDGVSYNNLTAGSASLNTAALTFVNIANVLNAGEKLAISSSASSNYNISVNILEFPESYFGLKSATKKIDTIGYNTVYTTPANKTTLVLSHQSLFTIGAPSSGGPSFMYSNFSGASTTQIWHYVPDGQTPSDATKINPNSFSLANLSFTTIRPGIGILLPSSSIVIESSSNAANQLARLTLIEF